MLFQYEAGILRFVHSILPEIELATYSKEEDMFNAMSAVTRFPAFFYYRSPSEQQDAKSYYFMEEDGTAGNYAQMEFNYTGRILVEDQRVAFMIMHKLRFGWMKNPYLHVAYPTPQHDLKVQLRLLYIKVDEERPAHDKRGAVRFVEWSWRSNMFFEEFYGDVESLPYSLVERVNIHLTTDGTCDVKVGNKLIKTIACPEHEV